MDVSIGAIILLHFSMQYTMPGPKVTPGENVSRRHSVNNKGQLEAQV